MLVFKMVVPLIILFLQFSLGEEQAKDAMLLKSVDGVYLNEVSYTHTRGISRQILRRRRLTSENDQPQNLKSADFGWGETISI